MRENESLKKEEKEALPSVHLGGMRIYLTEFCNAKCAHCFNVDIRQPKHMNKDKLLQIFQYLKENNVSKVKIMGGEPTTHPEFVSIFKKAQKYFERVFLFTNALNDEILHIIPRKEDAINYNFLFINEKFDLKKFLPEYDFYRAFEVVIDSQTKMELLFDRIKITFNAIKKLGLSEKIMFQITPNCTENILQYRKDLANKFFETIRFVKSLTTNGLSFDHSFPLCFWDIKEIVQLKKLDADIFYKSTCSALDAGLINAEFQLLHCNQYPFKVVDMFDYNNNLIDFNYMVNALIKTNMEKRAINFGKGCSKCKYFNFSCTGGCMMHKDFVNHPC